MTPADAAPSDTRRQPAPTPDPSAGRSAPAAVGRTATAPTSTGAALPERPPLASAGDGWVQAVEFVTATLTWGAIGWLVDRWLGTAPWLMSIGFVVGNGAGIYLLWLRGNAQFASPEAGPAAPARKGPAGGAS